MKYLILYNPKQNGNDNATGSYLINEITRYIDEHKSEEYLEELQKLNPVGIFGAESSLNKVIVDVGVFDVVDALEDRKSLVYDYKLLEEILEKNEKTFEEYESGMSREMIMNYPKLYAEKLAENPIMNDMKFLRENIRRKTNGLVGFLLDKTYQTQFFDITADELLLTDEEIDFLLSIHRRILNTYDCFSYNI